MMLLLAGALGCQGKASGPVVTLTDGAVALLRQFSPKQPLEARYVRVAVTREGEAFRYYVDFGNPAAGDIAYVWKGARIQIDSASAPYLQGAIIDVSHGANGGAAFTFTNPNSLGPLFPGEPGGMPPPVKLKKAY